MSDAEQAEDIAARTALGDLVAYAGNRELAEDIHFITECIRAPPPDDPTVDSLAGWYPAGEELHLSQNAFLVGDEETLLFDTLTPVGREAIVDQVAQLLDGRDLDYLAISHPEANHAGNTGALMEAFPGARLVAPAQGTHHDMFGIGEDDMLVGDGDVIDLGDRQVEFVEPWFYDHAMTTWMREMTTETLFTVDFLGFEHVPGECLEFADELDTPVTASRLERFNSYAFTWLRYVDTDETDAAIDAILEDIDPSIVAPAHGRVIRENPAEYLELMREAIHDYSEVDPETYHVHTHKMRAGRGDGS